MSVLSLSRGPVLLILVYHHYEIFPVDERPREQVNCQLGAGGCIPGAPSGSRLSTGNRRLETTVFPVDGTEPPYFFLRALRATAVLGLKESWGRSQKGGDQEALIAD